MNMKTPEYISMNSWGKDHWSTLAYIEDCCVDKKGVLDNRKMRCNARLHRELANISNIGTLVDGKDSHTRLNDGTEIGNHDDWSCVEDMEHEGLLTYKMLTVNKQPFGCYKAKNQVDRKRFKCCIAIEKT